jgi:hypothetical protein
MTILETQKLAKKATLGTNRMIDVLQNGRLLREQKRLIA